MRAGPKAAVTAEPLDLQGLGRTRHTRCVRFIETHLLIPKGTGARKPVRLRPWQKTLLRTVLAPGVRQALASLPRGNGKSALAAMIAVWALFDGPEGAQVLTVASDQRQAMHVWGMARRMIETSPLLAEQVQIFQDRIYLPAIDGTLAPLPATPDALQGFDPSFVVVDELHVVSRDTWEAVSLASGKRDQSVVLAISTPSDSKDSVMWDLVAHGREGSDPSFAYVEHAAPDGCAPDDEAAWHQANPALGDFLALDALRATYRTTREESWRRYRLGQWVAGAGAWLPFGAWDACADQDRPLRPGERVVVALDGSFSGDSTAILVATAEAEPHLALAGAWERSADRIKAATWRVPHAEVNETLARIFDAYDVAELAYDPFYWQRDAEVWAQAWPGRVVEWRTNVVQRMAPACERAFVAICEGRVTHDGSPTLARHFANARGKRTSHGDVFVKSGADHKIDAAVAAVVAFDRAIYHARAQRRRDRVATFA